MTRLATVREVMEWLHISRSTLYRRPYRYTLEGRRRLYFVDDIELQLNLNSQRAK